MNWNLNWLSFQLMKTNIFNSLKTEKFIHVMRIILSFNTWMDWYDAVKVLHSICQQIWETQQWPHDWKRSVFIPIPRKGSAKECSNYCTIALISDANKVMLKILQARIQQYVNQELPDVQDGFTKGKGTKDQIGTSAGS